MCIRDRYMRGWRSYFGYCETPEVLVSLTRWVRLRLRAAMWRQWKTPRRRREALLELGVRLRLARNTAGSGLGPWYLAKAKALSVGLSNASVSYTHLDVYKRQVECDPIRGPGVESTRLKMSVLDPVVDNAFTDTKMFCYLCDGQLFRLAQHRRRDSVSEADLADDQIRESLACGADRTFPAKLLSDLGVSEVARQLPYTIDNCGRIAHAIRYVRPELESEVGTGISLPADVNQKLLGNR